MKGDDILERLLDFGARAGVVVDALPDTRLGRHIAGQRVRSGTSPAPNYSEGQAAEGPEDFCHKLGVALKEMREAHVWLRLIVKAGLLPNQRLTDLLDECDQLTRILAASIITAKRNHPRGPKA